MSKIFKNKRILFISLFLMAVLSISLGYAYVKSRLNINGNTTISQNSWIFYFDNVVEKDNNVTTENPALIEPVEKRRIDFEVPLEKIQDTYEFNVDIVNAGSLKGQVDQIIKSALTVEQLKKLEFDIRYEDGTPIKVCDVIEPNSRKTITVRVRLKEGEKYQTKEAEDIPLSFEVTYVQYDENRTCDDTNTYSLTIDPGEGTYRGKTGEPTIVEGLYNETRVNLGDDPTFANHYFTYWEAINNDDYKTEYEEGINTVTIKGRNAYVLAHYESSVGPYTLTIDPGPGTYKGVHEPTIINNLKNGAVVDIEADAKFDGKLFKRWNPIVNNQYNTKYNKRNKTITIVDKNAYLEAEYGDAIAKIVETNKLYSTIENAFDAAEPGQTILLLDDTEENPLTEKKLNRASNEPVILDLDGHKVTGELINNDIITIVNGTIENLNGIAVINNGTLTLGVNDGTVNVDDIKLIGKNTNGGIGLQNKGIFNFYDGYLDAFIGLDGIFHDIPFEHYVFVDDDIDVSRLCQKVYVIERPTRVVARSVNSNGGVMFYFNLQKAFNTSAAAYDSGRTLWIEAIKNIPGEYALDIYEGKSVFFNLKGYTVSMGYTLRNNGTLTMIDSGNETTHAKGKFETSSSVENNGRLVLKDIAVSASTNVDLIQNYGSLTIERSTLTALNGYVMEIKDGRELVMDSDTHLNANKYALLLTNPNPFIIRGGNVGGIYNKGNLTIETGTKVVKSANGLIGVYNEADRNKTVNFNLSGGTIEIIGNSTGGWDGAIGGIYNDGEGIKNIKIYSGTIKAVNNNDAYNTGAFGISSYRGTNDVEIFDVDMTTISSNSADINTYNTKQGAWNIHGGKITIHDGMFTAINNSTAQNGGAVAIIAEQQKPVLIEDGTFNVSGKQAYLITGTSESYWGGGFAIKGGDFVVNGENYAYLVGRSIEITIDEGNFESSHLCFEYGTRTINGGTFECGTYGVNIMNFFPNTTITFTMNAGNITSINNTFNLVDGRGDLRDLDVTVINGGRVISKEGYAVYEDEPNHVLNINSISENNEEYVYLEGATTGIYINRVGNVTIDKATIVGKSDYGIYVNNGITTFGVDESDISSNYPLVRGNTYGLYVNNGEVNIFDGIYKGETWGYYGLISGLPDAGELADDVEENGDIVLNVSYVQEQDNFLKIVRNEEELLFNSLQRAINAADDGETIIVLEDHAIKTATNVSEGKNVVVDFQGKTLLMSKQLTNDGTLIFTDTEGTGGISGTINDLFYNNGNLVINGGNYTTTGERLLYNKANFTMNDGRLFIVDATTNTSVIYNDIDRLKTGSNVINGGEISVEGNTSTVYDSYLNAIFNQGAGAKNITINNGSINVTNKSTSNYGGAIGIWNNTGDSRVEIFNVDLNTETSCSSGLDVNRKYGAFNIINGDIIIHDGTFSATNNSTVNNSGVAMLNVNYRPVLIENGTFVANGNKSYFAVGNMTYSSGTLQIKDGNFDIRGISYSTIVVAAVDATIDGGDFKSSHLCFEIGGTGSNRTINGGTLECGTYGVYVTWIGDTSFTMTGGTLISNDNTLNLNDVRANYTENRNFTITGGKIISKEKNGIYFDKYADNLVIKASSDNVEDYPYIEGALSGVYLKNGGTAQIDKATVIGKTDYGVYTNIPSTFGTDDELVSNTYPLIKGEKEGLKNDNGVVNIYDGIFKGVESGISGFVSGFPDSYSIVSDTEEIDSKVYKTNYLEVQENFLKVKSTQVEYNSLQKAINAIESEDEIIVMTSHDIKNEINVPAGKNITIDFQGNTLTMSKQLINNGTLTLTDSIGEGTGGISGTVADLLLNNSNLIINKGNYTTTGNRLVYNKANFTMNDGKLFIVDNTSTGCVLCNEIARNQTGNIVINGGTIINDGNTSTVNYSSLSGIYNYGDGTKNVTIDGLTMNVINRTTSTLGCAFGIWSDQGTSNIEIFDADLTVEASTAGAVDTNYKRGAIAFFRGNIIIHDGTYASTNSGTANDSGAIMIEGQNAPILINGGDFTVTGNRAYLSTGYVYLAQGGVTVNGGTYTVTGVNDATLFGGAINSTVNGGTFTSSHRCFDLANNNANKIVTGGTIECGTNGLIVNGTGTITFEMTGGSITSNNNTLHLTDAYNIRTFNIKGGKLISREGYGIYSDDPDNRITINPDSDTLSTNYPYVEGYLNGIYMNRGNLTIGEKDGVVHPEYATIKGGEYGLYLVSNSVNNFYDGKIKGTVYGYNYENGTINTIEAGTYIYEDEEEINEIQYNVNYLKELSPIVKNTRTNEIYNDLQKAFDETKSDDILQLIDDVQLFYPVTIDKNLDNESVKAKLEFDGFDMKTTNAIVVNSGVDVEFINNHVTKTSKVQTGVNSSIVKNSGQFVSNNIDYSNLSSSEERLIVTNNGGVTTINNSKISSVNNVYTYNGGTTYINDGILNAGKISIYDEGTTNVDNCNIEADTYGVYSYTTHNGTYSNSSITGKIASVYKTGRNSIQSFTDTDLSYGYIYNDNGILNITNGTITIDHLVDRSIVNKATTYIKGATFDDIFDYRYGQYVDYVSMENSGVLTFENSIVSVVSGNCGNFTMLTNSGTFNTINSTFDINKTSDGWVPYNHVLIYGIYNSGDVNLNGGQFKYYETFAGSSSHKIEAIRSFDNSSVSIDGTTIDFSGGVYVYGINAIATGTKSNTINNSNIIIKNTSLAYGLYDNTSSYSIDNTNFQIDAPTSYGIYNNKASIVMKTGSIDVLGDTSYGVYINEFGSEFIAGEKGDPEVEGTKDAEVSHENPSIKAIGTTSGIGVKKVDGYFRFYDGIIIGNTSAKPEVASETNHINYVSTMYFDDDIDKQYEYCWLEFVGDIVNKNDMSASMNDVYYKTINAAVNRSNPNDIIIIQQTTNQNIIIPEDKDVTIDFEKHILSGTITNNGKLALINGEITVTGTEYDKAVMNNGTLIIGSDDNQIIDNYVIILGSANGLQNNGKIYMYDGYIRGTTPVSGNPLNTRYNYQIVNKEIDGYETVVVEERTDAVITETAVYNYEYDEDNLERTFTADESGYYKLEVWGAQGGSHNSTYYGGYGAYSKGIVYLNAGDTVYINVGSQGESSCSNKVCNGGYNGGGSAGYYYVGSVSSSGGGGATHIAKSSGLLSTFENKMDDLLIVAGGGGGSTYHENTSAFGFKHSGGSGGGIEGTGACSVDDKADGGSSSGCGGSQTSTGAVSVEMFGTYGSFGQGASNTCVTNNASIGSIERKCYSPGGGGGLYGGSTGTHGVAGGGSGYIGNSELQSIGTDYKVMYGYNNSTDAMDEINTVSTNEYSTLPESGKAKAGDGYARITKLIVEEN